MAVIDQATSVGRGRLSFAKEADVDEFVDILGQYERGEISPDQWRKYRLLRGTYGQRQDDVQMLRVKIPQGIVTAPQLRTLADIGEQYSRGFGHITTRQNVQFHFVQLRDVEAAMRQLLDVGVTMREACGNSVRNITSCPYAGVAADETFDVTPYAEAMTRFFLGHPLAGSLPRKFKIAFEGCPQDHALACIHDLGWFARIQDGRRGFRLTIGGGTSILPTTGYLLYEFVPAEDILDVAEAVVSVYHKFGDYQHRQRNRMKFLIKTLGWEEFKSRVYAEVAEIRIKGGHPLILSEAEMTADAEPNWTKPSAPSLDSVKRTASSVLPHGPGIHPGTLRIDTLSDSYLNWLHSNVKQQRQAGYVHVTVRVPLGDLTSGQLRVLADLSESYADGTARLTIRQNVLYRWVAVSQIRPLYEALRAAGLGASSADTVADVVSCPGAESCKLAVTQSRGLGRMLTEHLSGHPEYLALVDDGDIKVSGCPNGCGQHHIAAIGFQGSVRKVGKQGLPQYFVLVGGGSTDTGARFGSVVSKVPVRRLTEVIDRLLTLYQERREPGEALGAFFRRVPNFLVTDTLKDLAVATPDSVTPEDFIDLGDTTVFAPEVMEGECAS